MEKRTIGSFIAALRKVNGLTQKDLAEQLNVSDKTVSRWERDEGAPDLALIPVIAEIFHVSCDELLCGERRPIEEQPSGNVTVKAEKQRQRLLTVSMSKYQTKSYIAAGIAGGGLLAAFVCNFGFLRGTVGFFLGAAFFLASIICQLIFLNQAFLAVADDSFAEEECNAFKRMAVKWAEYIIGLNVLMLGFCLPMALNEGLVYGGLTVSGLLVCGSVLALAAFLLYATNCYFVNASLLKKKVYVLSEKQAEVYHYNHSLKRRCAVGLVITCIISVIVHAVVTCGWDKWQLAEGTAFNDYESFVAYMEQDIPTPSYSVWDAPSDTQIVPEQVAPGSEIYYDEYGNEYTDDGKLETERWYDENGNEITKEEALTSTLEDKDGNVLLRFYWRNKNVASIRYSDEKEDYLPITITTYTDINRAAAKIVVINIIFGVVYCVEIIVAVLIYLKKRKR